MTDTTLTFWRERARIMSARRCRLESALRIAVALEPDLLDVAVIAAAIAEVESDRP